MEKAQEGRVKQEIIAKTIWWGKISEKPMSWEDAEIWCKEQGGRLPTRVELLQAFEDGVDGFKLDYYWSSTEYGTGGTWKQAFISGERGGTDKGSNAYVRCVFG